MNSHHCGKTERNWFLSRRYSRHSPLSALARITSILLKDVKKENIYLAENLFENTGQLANADLFRTSASNRLWNELILHGFVWDVSLGSYLQTISLIPLPKTKILEDQSVSNTPASFIGRARHCNPVTPFPYFLFSISLNNFF